MLIHQFFKNRNGENIRLEIKEKDKFYKEIILHPAKFNFFRWVAWSLIFYFIGILFDLHLQPSNVLLVILFILIILLFFKINNKVTQGLITIFSNQVLFLYSEESLLVVTSVGVQLTTTFASGRRFSIFYDAQTVKDLVLNEAIAMHSVFYYLCLLLHDYKSKRITRLIPLLNFSKPSLKCLKLIRNELLPHLHN